MVGYTLRALCRAGRITEANQHLDSLSVTSEERQRIQNHMKLISGDNKIDESREAYLKSNNYTDLLTFVENLCKANEWDDVYVYGKKLFQEDSLRESAKYYAQAMLMLEKFEELKNFLSELVEHREQSNDLQLLYCWALYQLGESIDSKTELAKISNEISNKSFRELFMKVHISLGQWDLIPPFFRQIDEIADKVSPNEFIELARLAHSIGSNIANKFKELAIEKGKNDASVLFNAYLLSTVTGEEHKPETQKLIKDVVGLSDETGPLKLTTKEEINEHLKRIRVGEHNLDKMLYKGEAPLFMVADTQKITSTQLLLFDAESNLEQKDPRYQRLIPIYGGNLYTELKLPTEKSICLDVSTILTLTNFELLKETLDTFSKIYIPHSTINYLFNERNRIKFVQSSFILESKNLLKQLHSRDNISVYKQLVPYDNQLAKQIGKELATLLSDAKSNENNSEIQKVVVCSTPIYRIDSMMTETVDLSNYNSVLCGIQPVIELLNEKLTKPKFDSIIAFFELNGEKSLGKFEFKKGAHLLLNSSTINFFLQIGQIENINFLEELVDCGFKVYISAESKKRAQYLSQYDEWSDEIYKKLDNAINLLGEGVRSGDIKIGKIRPGQKELVSKNGILHPTYNLFSTIENCDITVIDDRNFNKKQYFEENDSKSMIATSYHILKTLVKRDKLKLEKFFELKTQLRKSGYVLIPVELDELKYHIDNISSENFEQSVELQAIRESIQSVQMNNLFQFSFELPWFIAMSDSYNSALAYVWNSERSENFKIQFSNWILNQVNFSSWSHLLEDLNEEHILMFQGRNLYKLITNVPLEIDGDSKISYINWLDSAIILPLKDEKPDLYDWLVEYCGEFVKKSVMHVIENAS